jgi:alpha-glucosidase (family GH31 glycosyl hydrolase)
MKRREFLSASLLAVTTATVPQVAVALSAFAPSQTYPVGDFILGRIPSGLQVTHKSRPDHVIWETPSDGEFIVAESATADIRSFGTPEGSFEIHDTVSASYEKPTIDAVVLTGAAVRVTGQLNGTTGRLGYQLTFEAVSSAHLRFVLTAVGPNASAINRMRLLVGSTADEGLFGFGQQLTYFNQKGHILPMLVQEHGVGRGQPIITQLVDLIGDRGGGTPYSTECPAPHFISSRLRSMFLENLDYSVFDLRPVDRIDIKVWSPVMTGRILYGSTPLDLIEAYTEYAGRLRALPDWIHDGIIVSVQGGTEIARSKFQALNKADIPLAGLWIQDWTGVRVTNVGKQLWWDWKLDENYYPGRSRLVDDLAAQGARMLTYINPFLSVEAGHDGLFEHAKANGYLVENADGTPFLNKNTNFSAALVDLSNPDARAWIKSSLLHSDTGGYNAFGLKLGEETIPIVARTPELFMRWIELNAFTAVFRTHEGLNPAIAAQFDTNADTIAHTRRFSRIYKGLAAYRKGLVADAAAKGHPVVRPLFLHCPNDPNTHIVRYQFLLGPDLMVAPVVEKGAETVDAYFPQGTTWIDLWTGEDAGRPGKWTTVPARLGKPAVFLRKGAAASQAISFFPSGGRGASLDLCTR